MQTYEFVGEHRLVTKPSHRNITSMNVNKSNTYNHTIPSLEKSTHFLKSINYTAYHSFIYARIRCMRQICNNTYSYLSMPEKPFQTQSSKREVSNHYLRSICKCWPPNQEGNGDETDMQQYILPKTCQTIQPYEKTPSARPLNYKLSQSLAGPKHFYQSVI